MRQLIRGGTLVDAAGARTGDLLLDGDRIAAVGDLAAGGAQVIDATGLHVAPGIIDIGVFATEVAACAAGGVTRVAVMPDGAPPLDDPGLVQRAALAAKPHLWVHPLAAATRGLAGAELGEYALMRAAGARGVATGRGWIADSAVMRRALAYAASLGLPFIAHAEDGGLTRGAVATEGEVASRHGYPAAPALAEAMAVARDLWLVEETGAPIHFRQLTTARALELVRAAKARGLPVTCGITPFHLILTDIDTSDFRSFARLSPPLRERADRDAARAALADGTIDILCSAHDPRGPEAKRLPFADAAPGASAVETLLPLSLSLVRDGLIGAGRLFELLSRNPARLLGVEAGALIPGHAADLVLYDPDKPWQVTADRFRSRAANSPVLGLPVQGAVIRTIKGGRIL